MDSPHINNSQKTNPGLIKCGPLLDGHKIFSNDMEQVNISIKYKPKLIFDVIQK
jgi:hypothetical protein